MKKQAFNILKVVVIFISSIFMFTACTQSQLSSDNVSIVVGQVHMTEWFNFTIHSITQVTQFEGHEAPYGHLLWLADITQTNTWPHEAIPMGTFDWYMDGDGLPNFVYPHVPFTESMMPSLFWLERNQSERYYMLFEIPANISNLTLNYTEFSEQQEIGRTFSLSIN